TDVSFIDPSRKAPRVQQWSADLSRELGGGMAITVTYMGARGDDLPLGGSNDVAVKINQLDPKYLALGSAGAGAGVADTSLRQPERAGLALHAGDDHARAVAAAVSAVRRRQHAPGDRGRQSLSGGGHRVAEAAHQRLGRAHQLHLQPAERQPVGRDELLLGIR